jgi:hypothetical protein
MTSAAKANTGIAARVEFYSKRVPEELYQTARDPDALQNLITEPAHKKRIAQLKEQLRRHMENSKDPQLIKFTR